MKDVLDASLRARAVSAIKRRNGEGSFAVVDHVEIITTSLQRRSGLAIQEKGVQGPILPYGRPEPGSENNIT